MSLVLSILIDAQWYLIVVLICISLMATDVEGLFYVVVCLLFTFFHVSAQDVSPVSPPLAYLLEF